MPGPSTAELNGLNPHVQVEPLTLAIVSLEELFEFPPHPATTTVDTTATKISDPKRFIDPPFPNRPSPAESPHAPQQIAFGRDLNKRNISSAWSRINRSRQASCPNWEEPHRGAGWSGPRAGPPRSLPAARPFRPAGSSLSAPSWEPARRLRRGRVAGAPDWRRCLRRAPPARDRGWRTRLRSRCPGVRRRSRPPTEPQRFRRPQARTPRAPPPAQDRPARGAR